MNPDIYKNIQELACKEANSYKKIYNIELSLSDRDPVHVRKNLDYQKYFDQIWTDLDIQI